MSAPAKVLTESGSYRCLSKNSDIIPHMLTIDQQIEEIQKEIRKTPYHKGTERHIGLLKAKVAKLKTKKEAATSRGSSGRGVSYGIKKQGDATIVLVGPPSVGKSTIINKLTNAKSKIAPYAFTTVSVIPGMMKYNHANIQILDVPGLIEGAEEGKGRGREVLSVVRGADLLVLVTDVDRLEAPQRIREALERNGIRINKTPPDISVEKKLKGGTSVITNIKQDLDRETIIGIANEFGFKNAEVTLREKISMEQLIDGFSRNRVYIPELLIINKADLNKSLKNKNAVLISAEHDKDLEKLKRKIFEKLDLIVVYLIKPLEKPHTNNPIIVKEGITLSDLAEKLGSEFLIGKTKAKIWGPGAKYPGQSVSLKHVITDKMQVRFI